MKDISNNDVKHLDFFNFDKNSLLIYYIIGFIIFIIFFLSFAYYFNKQEKKYPI